MSIKATVLDFVRRLHPAEVRPVVQTCPDLDNVATLIESMPACENRKRALLQLERVRYQNAMLRHNATAWESEARAAREGPVPIEKSVRVNRSSGLKPTPSTE